MLLLLLKLLNFEQEDALLDLLAVVAVHTVVDDPVDSESFQLLNSRRIVLIISPRIKNYSEIKEDIKVTLKSMQIKGVNPQMT